ncbi:MAG TPA: hypothetical protein VEA81_10120 [Burkholderiaceae bacterium]|nr:hypothetical protein [Burkholderiaceae bacterium]
MHARSMIDLRLDPGLRDDVRGPGRSLPSRLGRTCCCLYLRLCRRLGGLDRRAGRRP